MSIPLQSDNSVLPQTRKNLEESNKKREGNKKQEHEKIVFSVCNFFWAPLGSGFWIRCMGESSSCWSGVFGTENRKKQK